MVGPDKKMRPYLENNLKQKGQGSWMPVAHACNLSYSGGRHQEDHSSKSAQENNSQNPILKKTNHKKRLAEWPKQ
jgi:hypothetical protein